MCHHNCLPWCHDFEGVFFCYVQSLVQVSDEFKFGTYDKHLLKGMWPAYNLAFTCSKSIGETSEQCLKSVQS